MGEQGEEQGKGRPYSFRLPKGREQELEQAAKEVRRKVGDLVTIIIEDFLDRRLEEKAWEQSKKE